MHTAAHTARAVRISRAAYGKRPRRRLPRQYPPTAVRVEYFKALVALLERARAQVFAALRAVLSPTLAQAFRTDADGDEVNRALDRVSEAYFQNLRQEEIEGLARDVAGRTQRYQREQFDRQVRAAFGVDVLRREPNLAPKANAFVSENVALIKTIPNRYFDEVEKVVTRGLRAASTPKQLTEALERQFEISTSQARLIARDQVGKFFGELNQVRQESLGLTHYIWRTSQDERVREEHAEREGERFAWDDPPEGGHPGIDFQCFPGNTLWLTHSPIEKVYRRRYSGECTVLLTRDGRAFCATPNHPILTRSGFVPAQSIEIGEDILEAPVYGFGILPFVKDGENMVARAEEVFRAANPVGISSLKNGLATWFHSDGVLHEQVDVVDVDWGLGLELDSLLAERLCHDFLVCADAPDLALGSFAQLFGTALCSSYRAVRGFCKLATLLTSGAVHPKELGFAAGTWFDAALEQCSTHHSPRDVKMLRDLLLAPVAGVESQHLIVRQLFAVVCRAVNMPLRLHAARAKELAKPIAVHAKSVRNLCDGRTLKESFRVAEKLVCENPDTHVYNLQSCSGWYVAQNLIVSNCRCWAEPDMSPIMQELEE